ncbi:alpha-L-fucosidase [Chitinophaga pinensis]|uniref:alpha-L-fucosidase n=1 Tax=Chitinophaga pinensis TaxID=79329 RepID=UPI0021BDE0B3|nr:alpha-L-fucosidase [Chitinophaga pinensis]
MDRRSLLKNVMSLLPAAFVMNNPLSSLAAYEPTVKKGPFQPDWSSLEQYKTPEWYKDAKFGIWAHWGPQCQPEYGDWYARGMYQEGSDQYEYHLKKYGHPSRFGFKDVIHEWKAEQWDPEELVRLYKDAGAKYFVALANHHDNFDLYDSSFQSWNSVRQGPKKDIVAGWAKAAKAAGLHLGLSVHAAHAWSWMEVAQRHDLKGALSNIPYDGKLSKADGKGTWWEKLDPQELYAQNHPLSANSQDNGMIHRQWDWGNGVLPV